MPMAWVGEPLWRGRPGRGTPGSDRRPRRRDRAASEPAVCAEPLAPSWWDAVGCQRWRNVALTLGGGASMTKLREIMVPGFVHAVQRGATVAEAVRMMTDRDVGIVAVLDGDRLVGLVSERDVVRRVIATGGDPATATVDTIMTTKIVFASPDELFQDAVQ